MKIDLQIQTTASDGRDTPTEVVESSLKNNLDVIAITDHDTTEGIEEAQKAAKNTKLKVIPGIEMSVTYCGARLHILGYHIDSKNKKLQKFLDELNAVAEKHYVSRIPVLNKNLKHAGLKTVSQEAYKNLPSKYYRMPGLAFFLEEQGVVKHHSEAFQYFQGVLGFEFDKKPKDAIEIIHEAGGKAVFSHPIAPKISLTRLARSKDEQEAIIKEFIDDGLDGIECYTPAHSQEEQERIKRYALKYRVGITAGSDWHGHLSQTGRNILQYIPYYIKELGDLEVPTKEAQAMIEWLEA